MSHHSKRPKAKDIGAGLWKDPWGRWELIRVHHREEGDKFFFETGGQYVYGVNIGGYGRRELAHLYMSEKLSLSPELLIAEGHSAEPAVILNKDGQPVLAHPQWEEGLEPLLADPAFHAVP